MIWPSQVPVLDKNEGLELSSPEIVYNISSNMIHVKLKSFSISIVIFFPYSCYFNKIYFFTSPEIKMQILWKKAFHLSSNQILIMNINNYLQHCYFCSQCYKVFGQNFSLYGEGSSFFRFFCPELQPLLDKIRL